MTATAQAGPRYINNGGVWDLHDPHSFKVGGCCAKCAGGRGCERNTLEGSSCGCGDSGSCDSKRDPFSETSDLPSISFAGQDSQPGWRFEAYTDETSLLADTGSPSPVRSPLKTSTLARTGASFRAGLFGWNPDDLAFHRVSRLDCGSLCKRRFPGDGGVHTLDRKCMCCCWAFNQESLPTGWIDSLPDCPCSIGGFFDELTDASGVRWFGVEASKTFHPGGEWELRQRDISEYSEPGLGPIWPGQQCVYDKNGQLMNRGPAAGTPDMWSPSAGAVEHLWHFTEDVSPYNHCTSSAADLLNCYLVHRPPNQGQGCAAIPPAFPLPDPDACDAACKEYRDKWKP